MRKHFSEYIEQNLADRDDFVFVTGDLGYAALENVARKMGDRFINAGVAEQNMIGVAAGMASQGFQVMCYSIAPFVVYRCLEQMRNDVCFHNLPVYIVGNGGGYGYGIMGSSHHAIEDIATLSGLPNIQCYVPAFVEDMRGCIGSMTERRRPAYLRLGLGKNAPEGMRQNEGGGVLVNETAPGLTIVSMGPVTNNMLAALNDHPHRTEIDVFICNVLPLIALSQEMLTSIIASKNVLVIEEHISVGGLGGAVSLLINELGLPLNKFISLHAEGYPNGLYGNQGYHQQLSGLDEGNILKVINSYF